MIVTFLNKEALGGNEGEDCETYPWILLNNLRAVIDGVPFTIPAGFKTDLASVPEFLHFFCKEYGKHNRSAILHDILYAAELLPRGLADEIFKAALINGGVPKMKAGYMFWAVRTFGWFRFKEQHPTDSIAEIRSMAQIVDKVKRPLWKTVSEIKQG
jgi:hypothetical protein